MVDRFPAELEAGANVHLVEHQASGMFVTRPVSAWGKPSFDAGAHASSHDLGRDEVAKAVVTRQLRFNSSPSASGAVAAGAAVTHIGSTISLEERPSSLGQVGGPWLRGGPYAGI